MVFNSSFLIVEVTPTNNETSVPINRSITVRFAMDMDQDSINNGTMTLHEVNGAAVAITVSYDPMSRSAFAHPDILLKTGTQYQFSVLGGASGVKTATGTTLDATRRYEFTTTIDILITAPQSLNVVNASGHISLNWLEPDQYDTTKLLKYQTFISTSLLDPDADPGSILWPTEADSIEDTELTLINVSRKLEPNTYYAYVRGRNTASTGSWVYKQFVVAAEVIGGGSGSGGGSGGGSIFEVRETYPRADAAHIVPSSIKILFTSPVDMTSITNQTVYIIQKKKPAEITMLDLMTDFAPSKSIAFTIDITTGNIVSLTVDPLLLVKNMEFTIIVREDIKATDGSTLGEAYYWSFTTLYDPLYGDPDAIREDIKGFLTGVPDKSLYAYMSSVSQTAVDIISQVAGTAFDLEAFNADVPRYVKEFVRTQTAFDLLVNAFLEKSSSVGSVRTLGELTIDQSKAVDFTKMLGSFKDRIKPWLDELHGQHNRGYAKPTVTVKGENVEPYPTIFDRKTLKDINV
jgi:hypothetical protein